MILPRCIGIIAALAVPVMYEIIYGSAHEDLEFIRKKRKERLEKEAAEKTTSPESGKTPSV